MKFCCWASIEDLYSTKFSCTCVAVVAQVSSFYHVLIANLCVGDWCFLLIGIALSSKSSFSEAVLFQKRRRTWRKQHCWLGQECSFIRVRPRLWTTIPAKRSDSEIRQHCHTIQNSFVLDPSPMFCRDFIFEVSCLTYFPQKTYSGKQTSKTRFQSYHEVAGY